MNNQEAYIEVDGTELTESQSMTVRVALTSLISDLQQNGSVTDIGKSFDGVEKCFAVQAGREMRVVVSPDSISDEQAFNLSRKLARKIEDELQYPGQIRITVIRETRCIEFAK